MVFNVEKPTFPQQGTEQAKPFKPKEDLTEKEKCENTGGVWDEKTKTCIRIPKEVEPVKEDIKVPETFTDPKTGRASGVALPNGKTFLGLSPDDVRNVVEAEQQKNERPLGTIPVGTQQSLAEERQRAIIMAQQAQNIQQLPTTEPTEIDYVQAATEGVRNSIPRALGLAVSGAGIGALGGTTLLPGVGTAGGAVIGAASGFVTGISSGILSNMAGQRTDNINAQKRVLDEGKQTLQDWVTLAKTDPANRAFYLAQFKRQLSLIQQSHSQMKLDTQADVLKFNDAVPDLAEFDAFYSEGGERDFLVNEMKNALLTQNPEYEFLELANRRGA